MSTAAMDVFELDAARAEQESAGVVQAERQCRVELSKDWPRMVPLNWNVGGRGGRETQIPLHPGGHVVQPLAKMQVWFGPFSIPAEYAQTTDEGRKERLRRTWAEEKSRYLNRYDYPRPASMQKDGVEPIGPHRSPDVTVTIIEADGSESEPIRLYQLYKIGEFDPLKDTFGERETAAQVEERYKAELATVSARYEADQAAMRAQVSEMAGLLKGFMAGTAQTAAANQAATTEPELATSKKA